MGFTKLFSDILCSSVWNEDDKTRIVWITLLAMKGANNISRCSIDGLAHQARVSITDTEMALGKLSGPDRNSGDPEFDGRRIERVDHGWLILNGEKYRMRRDEEDRKEYMATYMRQYRRKQSVNNCKESKQSLTSVNGCKQMLTPSISPPLSPQSPLTPPLTPPEEDLFMQPSADKPSAKKKKLYEIRPESREDVVAFCKTDLSLTENDGHALWDHWVGNGFKVNGKPMNSWKHTAGNWKRRGIFFPSLNGKGKY